MMKIERVVAAALAGVAMPTVAAQDAVQWRVEDGGNGHWYAVTSELIEREAARSLAEERGGYLATPKSVAENAFLAARLAEASSDSAASCWLGLTQLPDSREPDGGWTWIDGSPLEWAQWATGEPDNRNYAGDVTGSYLAEMYLGGPNWADTGGPVGSGVGRAAIEWSADCNDDGIVDHGQILDGTMFDGDENGVPDCCELGYDCELNLIQNGSFETGPDQADCTWTAVYPGDTDLFPWMVSQSSVDRQRLSTSCTNESWQSFNGEFTVDLDGFSTAGAIEQVINTDPGRCYELSLRLTGNCGPDVTKRIRVSAGDSTEDFQTTCEPVNPQPWRSASMSFAAITSRTSVRIESISKAGINGPVIDDVRVSPYTSSCPADITGDGQVDAADLGVLLAVWNTDGGTIPEADINGDGTVNASDLGLLLGSWGLCSC